MKVAKFQSNAPQMIKPFVDGLEEVYQAPVEEFQLSKLKVVDSYRIDKLKSAEIIFVFEGEIMLIPENGNALKLSKGQSAFITNSADSYKITGKGTIYRAGSNIELR